MSSNSSANAVYALVVIGGVTWWWWNDKTAVEHAREAPTNGHIYVTTMQELQSAYESNEVEVDQAIGDSVIEVTGTVKSINAALGGDSARIETVGGGTIRLGGAERSSAAKLHKGEKVTFRCATMHYILGSPYGANCVIAR